MIYIKLFLKTRHAVYFTANKVFYYCGLPLATANYYGLESRGIGSLHNTIILTSPPVFHKSLREVFFLILNTHLTFNKSVSGLELCPKCKKGHLYPVVTSSVGAEPIRQHSETESRDYECAICGHKQTGLKQAQYVNEKGEVSTRVKKAKKPKAKKPKAKKPKAKKPKAKTKSRKRK